MIRASLLVVCVLGVVQPVSAFFCRYPPERLTGFADLGGSRVVRLDFDLTDLGGGECEVDVRGHGKCHPVRHHELGVEFALSGRCPSNRFVITDASYVRRADERVADMTIAIRFTNGDQCRITGVSPALYFNSPRFGGPLPSLSGEIVWGADSVGGAGVAELVR